MQKKKKREAMVLCGLGGAIGAKIKDQGKYSRD